MLGKNLIAFTFFMFIGVLAVAQTASTYVYVAKEERALIQVLRSFEKDYGLSFSFPVRAVEKVNLSPKNIATTDLNAFFAQLLSGTDLEYRVSKNKQVLLREKLKVLGEKEEKPTENIILSGRVIDLKTKEKVSNVAVYLDTLALGAITDEEGNFFFEIPPDMKGRKVICQILGYDKAEINVDQLIGKPEINIKASPLNLDPVTITESVPILQPKPSTGAISINTSNLLKNTASNLAGGDLFRSLQMLPGISAHNDLSASIQIRGSGGDETLLILDGIPIYKAEHYFGVFSAINSNYVQTTELFKNALPVSYGGKTGGMLLMNSNSGVNNRYSGIANINLLNSSLVFNTPIGKNVALIFSGRTTYRDAANNPLFNAFEDGLQEVELGATTGLTRPDLVETTPSFRFYDMNAKAIWRFSKKGTIDFNFYKSFDDFLNDYEFSYLARVSLNRSVINEEAFANAEERENTGLSLNAKYELENNWILNSNIYYTEYLSGGSITSSLTREVRDREFLLWAFENNQFNQIEDQGIRLQASKELANNRSLSFGTEMVNHNNGVALFEDDSAIFELEGQATEISLFGSLPLINISDFNLDLGTRVTYYSPTDKFYWSPRLNFIIQPIPEFGIKGSFTRANQFVREIGHENRLGQSLDFFLLSNGEQYPVGTSNNYMLGANWKWGNFSFDVEAYQKNFDGLIEHARVLRGLNPMEINPGSNREYKIFNGEGITKGIDFLLSYEKKNYSTWLAYTLSKTDYSFQEIFRGESFPGDDDRRHQLSWVNNYKWKGFNFSANYVFASGGPFSNLAVLQMPEDIRNLPPDDLWGRLPDYSRLDLGVDYTFKLNWTTISVGASLFNVTNHANVKYFQYIYSVPAVKPNNNGETRNINTVIGNTTRMLDRTLNLSLNVKF